MNSEPPAGGCLDVGGLQAPYRFCLCWAPWDKGISWPWELPLIWFQLIFFSKSEMKNTFKAPACFRHLFFIFFGGDFVSILYKGSSMHLSIRSGL